MDIGDLDIKDIKDKEPSCDLVECYKCNQSYDIADCPTDHEGDWETGYYLVHSCPKCGDDGEPDYTMSMEQAEKWNAWFERNNPNRGKHFSQIIQES